MRRTVIGLILLASWAAPAAAGAEELSAPLTVTERAGIAREAEYVANGIPLPRGAVRPEDVGSLCVVDEGGRKLPTQCAALGPWDDGSVRWILVQFPATVAANATARYSLRRGAEPAKASLSVQQDAGRVTVSTGPLGAVLDGGDFRLPGDVSLDGRPVAAGGGIVLTDQDGNRFRAAAGATVTVLQKGPLRAAVRVEGGFAPIDQGTAPDGLGYRADVYFYAGSPVVRVLFFLRHDSPAGASVLIRSLVLETNLKVGGARFDVAGQSGPAAGEPVRLLQYHEEKVPGDYRRNILYDVLRGGRKLSSGTRAEGWGALADEQLGLAVGVRHFWQQFPKSLEFQDNTVAVGLWPAMPEGVGQTPKHAGFADVAAILPDGPLHRIWGGTWKGHELVYCFHGKGRPAAERARTVVRALTLSPLVALPDPLWTARTMAVGPIVASAEFDRLDPNLRHSFDMYDRWERAVVDRGVCREEPEGGSPDGGIIKPAMTLFDARELMSGFPGKDRDENLVAFGSVPAEQLLPHYPGKRLGNGQWYGWDCFGDVPWAGFAGSGAGNFSNLHYDWVYGMALQALRTGELRFYDLAVEMGRHKRDMDYIHDPKDYGWRYEKTGGHGPSYYSVSTHLWLQGSCLHYLLTGETEGLEIVEKLAENQKYLLPGIRRGQFGVGGIPSRDYAWTLLNMVALYETTGKAVYWEAATKMVDTYLDHERKVAGDSPKLGTGDMAAASGWMSGMTLTALGRYWDVLRYKDPARAPAVGALVGRLAEWLMTEATNLKLAGTAWDTNAYVPMAYCYEWSRGGRNPPSLNNTLEGLNGFGYAYLATDDPTFLERGRWYFEDNFTRRGPVNGWSRELVSAESKVRGWIARSSQVLMWALLHNQEKTRRKPLTPLAVHAVPTDNGGAEVRWMSSLAATGYTVQRQGSGQTPFQKVAQCGPTELAFTDKGLRVGETYAYRVIAANARGPAEPTAPQPIVAVEAAGLPAAPVVRLTAEPRANRLDWEPVPRALSYRVYRSQKTQPTDFYLLTSTTEPSCRDAGIDFISTWRCYHYYVTAVSAVGEGKPSQIVHGPMMQDRILAVRRQILDWVRRKGQATTEEIASEFHLSTFTVIWTLKQVKELSEKNGVYTVKP